MDISLPCKELYFAAFWGFVQQCFSFKCCENILYLSILEENYIDSQIPQNRMRIIKVPAVVHVPIFVLSYDASAKSRNA